MNGIVAQRYAVSLFEVGSEENVLDTLNQEIIFLGEVFTQNPDLFKLLSTPAVTKQEKSEVLNNIFGKSLSVYALNFLNVITEKGRIVDFPQMQIYFKKLYNKKNNIKEVNAVTAIPLTDELFNKLKSKLEQITGSSIVLNNTVDTAILGGVVLKMDDDQMDGSVLSRLNALRAKISANIA